MPKENQTFREYLANMGSVERQLLNQALIDRGIELGEEAGKSNATITEARALLPESLQREIRLRARNQAWQSLAPEEAFDRKPSPKAARISDAIAHIRENLQERASIARATRNDFMIEQVRLHESRIREREGGDILPRIFLEDQERVAQRLAPAAAHRLAELDRYADETREDVYRASSSSTFSVVILSRLVDITHFPPNQQKFLHSLRNRQT